VVTRGAAAAAAGAGTSKSTAIAAGSKAAASAAGASPSARCVAVAPAPLAACAACSAGAPSAASGAVAATGAAAGAAAAKAGTPASTAGTDAPFHVKPARNAGCIVARIFSSRRRRARAVAVAAAACVWHWNREPRSGRTVRARTTAQVRMRITRSSRQNRSPSFATTAPRTQRAAFCAARADAFVRVPERAAQLERESMMPPPRRQFSKVAVCRQNAAVHTDRL
jgi:hypothetical protein